MQRQKGWTFLKRLTDLLAVLAVPGIFALAILQGIQYEKLQTCAATFVQGLGYSPYDTPHIWCNNQGTDSSGYVSCSVPVRDAAKKTGVLWVRCPTEDNGSGCQQDPDRVLR